MKARALISVALGAALMALVSQLAIPLPWGVPLTVQTLGVGLLAGGLGPKKGTAALVVWLALGGVGAPVFAHFQGGLFHLLQYTGGFLWGFLPLCYCAGRAPTKRAAAWGWIGAGLLLCHLLGTVQFCLVSGNPFWVGALSVSLPYLIKDGLLVRWGLGLGRKWSKQK